jgi:hypothetical protein
MVALARSAIEATKDCADCQEIAERYGLRRASGTRGGWQLYYRPGGERKASFGIRPDGWRDFASGEHGDVYSLIQMITGCSFLEAVAALGGDTYTPITNVYTLPSPVVRKTRTTTATWQTAATTALDRAIAYLRANHHEAQRVRAYLHDVRGLTDDTIISAKLGYLPDWTKTTYTKDNGKAAYVAPGIVIPTFIDGKLEALKVRTRTGNLAEYLKIAPDTDRNGEVSPKYIQMAGGNPSPLYGGDLIRAGQPVIIVEGEFDALIGNQHASELATFVTIGSASNTVTDATRERLEVAARIIAAPDNDKAGDGGAKRITDALPLAMVATIPTGKDVTEFVTSGGDVRQWVSEALSTSPALTLAALPDGVRSAGLNAKLKPAVIVYELAKLAKLVNPSGGELLEASKRLGVGIDKNTICRGLKLGDGIFFTPVSKSDTTNTPSSIDQYVVSDFDTEQTTEQRYTLNQLDQIKIALRARTHYRMIERLFPSRRAELPPIEAELIKAAGHDDPSEVAAKIQAIVDSLTTEAERDKVKKRIGYERWAVKCLETMLTQRHTTPIRWVKGVDFAAQYYRAIYDTDPKSRSEREIGLIVGLGRQNLDGLIERAGLTSKRRGWEKIQLTDPAKIDATVDDLYCRAKGNGQIGKVSIFDAQGLVEETPFVSSEVKTLAASSLASGRTLEFAIHLHNEQKIAGEVQPRRKPERAERPPRQLEMTEPPAPTPARVKVVKPLPYVGEGYDPAYARATLIKIHARSWALSPNDPDYANITTSDLIGLLIDEPTPFKPDDLQIMDDIAPSTVSDDLTVELETPWKPSNPMQATSDILPEVVEISTTSPTVQTDQTVDSPFAAWLIAELGGTVAIAEHPGKVLLDAYNALPSYLAQCDYYDGLTTNQRHDLIDYKTQYLSEVA